MGIKKKTICVCVVCVCVSVHTPVCSLTQSQKLQLFATPRTIAWQPPVSTLLKCIFSNHSIRIFLAHF